MKKGSNAELTLEGAICIFDKALPLTGLQTKAKDGQFIPRRENLTSTFHHELSAELTVGLWGENSPGVRFRLWTLKREKRCEKKQNKKTSHTDTRLDKCVSRWAETDALEQKHLQAINSHHVQSARGDVLLLLPTETIQLIILSKTRRTSGKLTTEYKPSASPAS